MRALHAAWMATREGFLRALQTPAFLAAFVGASALQLVYEKKRPDSFPAAADWGAAAGLMSLYLAFVLRALAPGVPFGRALGGFAAAQAASTALLTMVFLVARAGFLSLLAPAVPAALCAFAAFLLLGRGKRPAEAAWLGALYALTSWALSLFLSRLPGGGSALPATAFFAFMGVFAAAAPASLE